MLENEPVTLVTHHFLPDSFKVFLTQKRLVSFEITIWYDKLRQKYNKNGTHSFSLKLYQLRRWNWLLSGNSKYLALVLICEKETFGRNFSTVSCVFKVKLSNFCHRACPSTNCIRRFQIKVLRVYTVSHPTNVLWIFRLWITGNSWFERTISCVSFLLKDSLNFCLPLCTKQFSTYFQAQVLPRCKNPFRIVH